MSHNAPRSQSKTHAKSSCDMPISAWRMGVITMHADFSGQLEQEGVKVTLIYAGSHKADGNPFEALPDAVRASIQANIDRAYNLFVAHIAAARGMSEDAVRATEAQVYQGQLAVDAGLVDKVTGSKLAAVGEFLSGPWGMAVIAGIAVLSPFVLKLVEGNDKLGEAVEKLKKDAEASEIDRQAKEKFAHTIAGVTSAIEEQRVALDKSIESERTSAEQADIKAKRELFKITYIRQATAAILEQTKAQYEQARAANATNEGADVNTLKAYYGGEIDRISKEIKSYDDRRKTALDDLNKAQVDLAAEQGKQNGDPIAKINKQYDEQIRLAKEAARANRELTASLSGRVAVIETNRNAALKAEREAERTRKPKVVSLGDQLEAEQGQRLLSSAQGYAGMSETRDNSALRDLFAKANEHIDPKMTAWCAAFVNAVLATNGLPGTGSLSARSFLGYGSSTDKPEKGDIVVSRRGTGAQGHVGFFEGLDAKGNIRVLGGNTSDKVGTETVKRSDVLGFRRAPSAADSYKADEEAAKKNAELTRKAADDIARINAQWDEQPRLIDRAGIETHKLDEIIADLTARKPPGFEQLIADAQHAKQTIQDGINRPFNDYVKTQRESLAVQGLILQGRDVEANALQVALRLQQQMGPLNDQQLATILKIEQAQQRIASAIEDQRRVVGLYSGAVGDLEQSFNTFLNGLRTKPGAALKDLAGGVLASFTKLQSALTTEQLFGGVQRDIERYVAQKMGGSTPADMLKEQLAGAGTALTAHVDATGSALDGFVSAVRTATSQISGIGTPVPTIGPVASSDLMSTKGFEALTQAIIRVDQLLDVFDPVTGVTGKTTLGAIAKIANNLVINLASPPYNVVPDYQEVRDGVTTAGSTNIDSASGQFRQSDVGKMILISNAVTTGGGPMASVITGYVSPTRVTIRDTPNQSYNTNRIGWGTDNTAGVRQAAADSASRGLYTFGTTVIVPAGGILTRPFRIRARTTWLGQGGRQSYFVKAPALPNGTGLDAAAQVFCKNYVVNNGSTVDGVYYPYADDFINLIQVGFHGGRYFQPGGEFVDTLFLQSITGAQGNLAQVDPFWRMAYVDIFDGSGNGFHTYGRSSSNFQSIGILNCNGMGYFIESYDDNINTLVIQSNGQTGVYYAGANGNMTTVKVSYNGTTVAGNRLGANVVIDGTGAQITGMRVQESGSSNMLLRGNGNHLTGCSLEDTGCIYRRHGQGPKPDPVTAGIYLWCGTSYNGNILQCYNNKIRGLLVGPAVHADANAQYASHGAYFNGTAGYGGPKGNTVELMIPNPFGSYAVTTNPAAITTTAWTWKDYGSGAGATGKGPYCAYNDNIVSVDGVAVND